ncbi:MAG: AAA family ATPase [Planctomycetota bacterium]
MMHSDFNLVLKYCEVLDEFVKIRVFADEDAQQLLKSATAGDKTDYQRAVVNACISEFNDEILPRIHDLEESEGVLDVEEMLYLLCIDVNPSLDIHQVSVEINTSDASLEDDPGMASQMRRRSRSALQKISDIDRELKKVVIGQDRAVDLISRAVKKSAVGLRDPKRPIGAFLFVGQVGVGKTELAKALSNYLYGNCSKLIRVDCSEYALPHEYAKLIGSPPGYIGHNEGGYLTEAAKEHDECIILFDEIEKAHSKMHNILLQLLDEGMVTDSKGFKVSFRNAMVLMTSNLGVREVESARSGIGFDHKNKGEMRYEEMKGEIFESLKKAFRPEFINRLDDVIIFNTLTLEDSVKIVEKMMEELTTIGRRAGIGLNYGDELMTFLAEKGFKPEYGARELRRTIKKLVEDPLTDMLLNETLVEGNMVQLDAQDGEVVFDVIDLQHTLAEEPS